MLWVFSNGGCWVFEQTTLLLDQDSRYGRSLTLQANTLQYACVFRSLDGLQLFADVHPAAARAGSRN